MVGKIDLKDFRTFATLRTRRTELARSRTAPPTSQWHDLRNPTDATRFEGGEIAAAIMYWTLRLQPYHPSPKITAVNVFSSVPGRSREPGGSPAFTLI